MPCKGHILNLYTLAPVENYFFATILAYNYVSWSLSINAPNMQKTMSKAKAITWQFL